MSHSRKSSFWRSLNDSLLFLFWLEIMHVSSRITGVKWILNIFETKTLLPLLQRKLLWSEEKYYKYRCPCAYTHTRNTHTAHTKADRLCIILSKLNPNQFLLILSLFLPSKVPHNCPTPHIPPSCPTKAPPLSSFQTCPQDRRASMQQSMQDFLSMLLANLKMWLLYSPEKEARFGNKSKYDFLGNHHSQTHRAA